jgi:microcystin degradation protein MlrC
MPDFTEGMANEIVLVGLLKHETNTFFQSPTDRESFQHRYEHFGEEIPAHLRGTNTSMGGVIDVAEQEGVELIYTVAANAHPGGKVTAEAYEYYTDYIVSAVREHRDEIDGVMLPLHGAMVPEGMDDGEGPFVSRIREIVGPDIPISVVLDLHGNNSDELFEAADSVVGFETYPHVDMGDSGRVGMRILTETIRNEVDPVMHVERPPVIPYGTQQNTRKYPMARVMSTARELEEKDGVLKATVFTGFLQSDTPSMSVSIPVVANSDPDVAREVSRELAELMWDLREDFIGDYLSPNEAVGRSKEINMNLEDEEGPVLMAELGPVTGAGGSGDGTTLLRAMLEQGVENAGYAEMCDPESLEACIEAGVGSEITLTIGGKTDDQHGDPIEDVTGYVKAITDGTFVNTGLMATGEEEHLGRAVRFQCGENNSIDVILTERRHQPWDAEIWRHIGIQPERYDTIGIASQNHFRTSYEPFVNNEIMMVESPGLGIMDPTKFDYENLERPKFPIDNMDPDDYPNW